MSSEELMEPKKVWLSNMWNALFKIQGKEDVRGLKSLLNLMPDTFKQKFTILFKEMIE
jgi:hypothetical protein